MDQRDYLVLRTLSDTELGCTQLIQLPGSNQLYIYKVIARETTVYAALRGCGLDGIPKIYWTKSGDGKTEVLEEFLNGKTLEEYVRLNGPISEDEARRILVELCRILMPLHQRGIIHRDIKPANIILTPNGSLYLIDFDAARRYSASEESDTVLLGTKGYAAPEQYGYAQTDCRSDIYALGVTVNRLMTGCVPSEKLASGPLGPILRKCTQLDPSDRYDGCGEILAELIPPQGPCIPAEAVFVPSLSLRREWWRLLILGFFAMVFFFIEFEQPPFTFDMLSEYCLDLVILIPPAAYLLNVAAVRTCPPLRSFRTRWRRILFGIVYFAAWFAVLMFISAIRSWNLI